MPHRRRLITAIVCSLFVTCFSANTRAESEDVDILAAQWLERMSRSFRDLNYQGVFTYEQGGDIESLRIAHAVIDGEEYERLEYMDGEQREIIRRGHNLTCIQPGHQLVRLFEQHQAYKQSPESNLELNSYYQFSIEGRGRIAGRSVIELAVTPRDTHRFGQRLSLDEETGLLMRSVLQGDKGIVLERFQFVDISVGAVMAADKFSADAIPSTAPQSTSAPAMSQTGSSPRGWAVSWLPGGFMAAPDGKLSSGDMVTYSDGLAVFSVFLERIKVTDSAIGQAQRGATVAYSKALLLSGQPHRVTVVGEIPPQTAQRIALSVQLQSKP